MTLVIIPARMGSTRLPGKPLLKIGDKTIIERCVDRASVYPLWPIVATDSREILNLFPNRSVLTGECASGTDRVAAAAEIIDPIGQHEFVINVQGDMPFIDSNWLRRFVEFRESSLADVVTAYAILEFVELRNEFTRSGGKCHIGLYGYERSALKKFARLPQSAREIDESLEQLRDPTEFTWDYFAFPSMPIEINTQADLDRARSCLM